jgi:hypothetical protein
MKHFIATLLLFSIAFSSSAQTDAEDAILQLKQGTLIVKLIKQQKKIDMLLKQGKKEEAIAYEKEEKFENESLIQSFSRNYSFSKILFVYNTDMGKLAEGDPTVLFDKDGKSANKIPADYLFVELGESLGRSIDGFVVRDRNNDQLAKPFPYFVSHWDFFHIKKVSFPQMIEKWEKQLNSYYNKVITQ